MNRTTNGYLPNDKQIILKDEQYLSPYGRKVMATLMHLKKERKSYDGLKSNLNPPRQLEHQNKKVLSFNNNEVPKTCPIDDDVNKTSFINSNNVTPISSSSLLKLPYNNISGITGNVCQTNVTYINNNSLNIQQLAISKETADHEELNRKPNNISWDSMFETDIFELCEEADDIEKRTETFTDGTLLEIVANDERDKLVHETIANNDNITSKVKCKTKTVKTQIKKSIISVSKKSNLRKEKYTTTIKNWLDDVDALKIVEKKRDDSHKYSQNSDVDTLIINEDPRDCSPQEIKISNKKNKNKRTIQAQLANKDGVMKYKKPKINENNEMDENGQVSLGSSNRNILEDVHINKPKTETDAKKNNKKAKSNESKKESYIKLATDNKLKPKLVAPIESQIPVKDITYKVVIINSLIDMNTVLRELETDQDECVITLVYSNGFSQLNRQHSADACPPEGIMLYMRDTFYYIEDIVDGIKKALGGIFSNSTLISFDAKSILVYLTRQYNFVLDNLNIFDTKIASSLITPDEPAEYFSEIRKLLEYRAEYTIATDCTLQKVAWYMTLLRECATKLKNLLLEHKLWNLFNDIEMKILPVIAGMEQRGISVDVTKLKAMEDVLMSRMKDIESQCHRAAGKVFNINSAVQVRRLIYDELQLDTASNVRIRETICKGAKSTAEAMLRPLAGAHPLPRLILEYRHLHKAHATFVAGIAQHVRDNVVTPSWEQTAAATGRIASNNPNLQAIPKMPFDLVLFPDHSDTAVQSLKFRSVYAARAGRRLLAADFKHVECRVFAHAAGDAGLQRALAGADLFRELAARWRGTGAPETSPEDRERTKRIVYASLYGAGARKLAEILDLGYDQALSLVSSFNRTFPALKSFGRSVVARCEAQAGRLATASGRARTFSDIASADFHAKSHAERQAVNFIIQGTAADLCKLAMIRCSERLRSAGVEAFLLLQIHDELVWEVPHLQLDTAAVIIKSAMESCGEALGLPTLPVALYSGASWGDLEELSPAPAQQQQHQH